MKKFKEHIAKKYSRYKEPVRQFVNEVLDNLQKFYYELF